VISQIHILQGQDHQMVGEANDLIAGIRAELHASMQQNCGQWLIKFLRIKVFLFKAVQKTVGILTKRVDEVKRFYFN